VHQHRRLGVPVGLGADVDAGDDDVDLVAGLGELDERRSTRAIQSMFSVPLSIEIFAPADSANHSSGTPHLLGQVEPGDDPAALGLGERAQVLGSGRRGGSRASCPPGTSA
jgi:hypothetical protein